MMEDNSAIFTYLYDKSYDAVELAEAFISGDLPDQKINESLTSLLLNSYGIEIAIPEKMIADKSYDDILNFIEDRLFHTNQNAIPLNTSKYYDRFIKFFETVITSNWSYFTNDGIFDSYLAALIDALTFSECTIIHVSSFAIKLKFVTGYLKSANGKPITDSVQAYAKELLKKAISFIAVQCSLSALDELLIWVKLDDEFAKDEYLRIITWNMKMDKPKLVCGALKIAHSLLGMRQFRGKFFLFVRKLAEIFEDLCYTENKRIFDWICRCYELIFVTYKGALLSKFVDELLDNLYAKDRDRAKTVAKFWIKAMFEKNSPIDNARIIIKFLTGRKQLHGIILVDSLLDDYEPMTNWALYVEMLIDQSRNGLNYDEKQQLLSLMLYAVEEVIKGPPEYRADKVKPLSFETRCEYATKLTKVMVPHLKTLSKMDFPRKLYARTTLLKIVKNFIFGIVDANKLQWLISECVSLYESSNHASSIEIVIEVILWIRKHSTDQSITHACEHVCKELKNDSQLQFEKLVNDFCKNPQKYLDPGEKPLQKSSSIILLRMYVLNSYVNCDRKYTFDIPCKILQHVFLPDNPVFLYMMHVCILLISEHVDNSITTLKSAYDTDSSSSAEEETIIKDLHFTIKAFSLGLRDWYGCELSVVAFYNLKNILKEAKSLKLDKKVWNELCPTIVQRLITAYVGHVVWNAGDLPVKTDRPLNTKMNVLRAHLDLILSDILPTTHVYDAMKNISKQRAIIEEWLRNFMKIFSTQKDAETVATWLLKWLQTMYNLSLDDCVDELKEFIRVIYPIKKQIQHVIHQAHILGIDYALASNGDEIPKCKFLIVLAELCVCLEPEQRTAVFNYFTEKRSNADPIIIEYYTKWLKKQTKFEPIVASTPIPSSPSSSSRLNLSALNRSSSDPVEASDTMSSFRRSSSDQGDLNDSEMDSSCEKSVFVISPANASSKRNFAQMLDENKLDDMDNVIQNLKECSLFGSTTSESSWGTSIPRSRKMRRLLTP